VTAGAAGDCVDPSVTPFNEVCTTKAFEPVPKATIIFSDQVDRIAVQSEADCSVGVTGSAGGRDGFNDL
jgi:hypothetical protein